MNILLQVCDLPSTTPLSRVAYWQSEALSHPAQVGSQSQLNARKLVSCPSLLAAALVSDPSVVLEPILRPPKQSEVADWLRQLNYGQPVDSKQTASNKHTESRSATTDLLPADYGQPVPVDSKQSPVLNQNTELVITTLSNIENQEHETLRSGEQDFDIGQQKNGDGKSNSDGDVDDEIEKKRKKSLLLKRQCRVSFLTDGGQTSVSLAESMPIEGLKYDDNPVADKSCLAAAAADDDDDKDDPQKLAGTKSPISDCSPILLCNQPNSGGQHLPKASFIDLEVPDSWRARRQSQMSDSSRHSGSVDFPPLSVVSSSAAETRLHVASTPTTSVTSHHGNEVADLSVISCSPITPRTTSDPTVRSTPGERTCSSSASAHEGRDGDDDDVMVVPCSPLTPTTTSNQRQCVKDSRTDDDDDDVTVIPCTPVSAASSQTVKIGSWDERLPASAEGQQDRATDNEELTVVPCSPVTPTNISNQAAHHKPQRVIQRISRLKVILTFYT